MRNYRLIDWTMLCLSITGALRSNAAEAAAYDVVIYGNTSAGVIAAVQAQRMGKSVVLVGPDKHLGGLSAGGLGFTDTGDKSVIGGLAREFYHHVWQHYQTAEAWPWQPREKYGNKGQGTVAIDGEQRTMWIFEPHVAEAVFEKFVADHKLVVHRDEWLDRENGVLLNDGRIAAITMLSGKTFRGRMFIDATYEGDLLAAAGCSYHVGREAQSKYDEKWNGVQVGVLHHGHHFGEVMQPISPYVVPGDPKSGVLPLVSSDPPGEYGAEDKKIQAYCFRMCLTDHEPNRVPFAKPDGYDPQRYELLARVYDAGWRQTFAKFDPIPNYKTDTNNHGPVSTDHIGANWDYPEASYERRREIIRDHEQYQQGWLYFIANDPRVPDDVRQQMSRWGLARDEFKDNGHWPHQIYVREARRLIGEYVMTENELLKRRPTPQSVGMGSYTMDSHNVQRYITHDGFVQNEGDIAVGTNGAYEIAFGSLLPKRDECQNLLVPVCVGSSHIAYGSIRMEPVFMILGQSAATAAALAIDNHQAVQDVDYDKLRERLLADGQVLQASRGANVRKGIPAAKLPGIVVDDRQAKFAGDWPTSTVLGKWVGESYRHDGGKRDGESSAWFTAELPKAGRYEVRLAYSADGNRATNVPVVIEHWGGETKTTINQQQPPDIDGLFTSLGVFDFSDDEPATVIIRNKGVDGHVIVDAVQWLPAEPSP